MVAASGCLFGGIGVRCKIVDGFFLGGGFKYCLFSPLFGEDEPNLTNIFFRWVETTNQFFYKGNSNKMDMFFLGDMFFLDFGLDDSMK